MDELITELHFEDVRTLPEACPDRSRRVLQALVDQGKTVVVIEHNLEVIKIADWVIDLGPEGGEIVAEGAPEDVAQVARSYTGVSEAAARPE